MTARLPLGDLLALEVLEHGPMPGSTLALKVRARKATVYAVLQADPRFEQLGNRRGSRWRLAGNPNEPAQEPLGPNLRGGSGIDVADAVVDRLAALERRVAEIERSIGRRVPT